MGARSLSQFRGGNQGLKRILMLGGYYGRTVERQCRFYGIRRDGRSGTLAA